MEFYMGKKKDVNKGFWMNFENHPRLKHTKGNIYLRCLPCLEKLYMQLKENPLELILEEPLNCWKIVIVLREFDECLDLLLNYQNEKFPQQHAVWGKVGTNNKESPNIVVIFQVHDEKQRDEMFMDLVEIAGKSICHFAIYYERGCQDLYVTLCGHWNEWKGVTRIKNLHYVDELKEKVGRLLRGKY